MLNFAVGPVQSSPEVLAVGSEQVPYFRTPEFSEVMLENERLMLEFVGAPAGSRAVFITGSGTASMESVVMNVLGPEDRAMVVNGGSFGERFCRLCDLHGVSRVELRPGNGSEIDPEVISEGAKDGCTSFLVNVHETSTGVLYDMGAISSSCREQGLFLVVDAISSFLADPLNMETSGIGVVITGSQKALACPPGVSIIVLSPDAIERVNRHPKRGIYLDLKDALENGERGQTPFTPAVGTLLQINERLRSIERNGGVAVEVARVRSQAEDFRKKMEGLPFKVAADRLSNAVTPLMPTTAKASTIVACLKDEYGIWVCPNGGARAETHFRVGHIGALTHEDNDALISALEDMRKRGII